MKAKTLPVITVHNIGDNAMRWGSLFALLLVIASAAASSCVAG